MTVEPQKAEGRLWILWAAFAKARRLAANRGVGTTGSLDVKAPGQGDASLVGGLVAIFGIFPLILGC